MYPCCSFRTVINQRLISSLKKWPELNKKAFSTFQKLRQAESGGSGMNVFDRSAKQWHRDRTANLENHQDHEYLRDEVAYRLADRISDIKRTFRNGLDVGCGRGFIGRHLLGVNVEQWTQCDMSQRLIDVSEESDEFPTNKIRCDEEILDLAPNSFDLICSSLSLHWVNDLPGCLKQINRLLVNDGAFVAAMFSGDTLYELRVSLQLAEIEREGGFGAHVSPFVTMRDTGGLLNQAGFTLLTVDVDEIVVGYPTMFELMSDLQAMAENNAAWNRKPLLHRDTMMAASAIYHDMYGNEDGTVPATFQVLFMIGWKPDKSQRKPAARGSANVSMKDIGKLDHNPPGHETSFHPTNPLN